MQADSTTRSAWSFNCADGPHNDPWKALLPDCFTVIDEVIRKHNVEFPIQIGGGSMLLRCYRHRKSMDLDVFVTDAQIARWFSPRFNEGAADLFPAYDEEAAAVKLVTGMQEVGIIAAAPIILEDATEPTVLGGREVLVERSREILAKKIVYRGRTFQVRDMFDLACVATVEPEEIAAIQPALTLAHLDSLDARLSELEPTWAKELSDKVDAYVALWISAPPATRFPKYQPLELSDCEASTFPRVSKIGNVELIRFPPRISSSV